jgi:hypothetical protein
MRKMRGRNQFTKAALGRARDVAREKGFNRVEIELPGGETRIVLSKSKTANRDRDEGGHNEWDTELYGKDKAPVHK